jgi:hypothetical protein
MSALSVEQVREILSPPTTSVEKAGRVLGLSRNVAYEAAARGDFASIRMGRRILLLTAPLRRQLGIES